MQIIQKTKAFLDQLNLRINTLNINIILIILVSSISSFAGIWDDSSQSLTAHDESLYAGRAKLMLESNDFFTPFDNPHHKTVGSYWLIALSMKVLGYTEASARLPSSLASIICCVLVYKIGRQFLTSNASLCSAILLPTMPLWLQYSRYSSPDLIFICCILFSLYFLLKANSIYINYPNFSFILWHLSGFFISLSFIFRSFMIALPIIGLLPCLYHSYNKFGSKFIRSFVIGIIIGAIPSVVSISIAFDHYGIESIYRLLDFAHKKAVGGQLLKGFKFYPLTVMILTYPASILVLFGFTSIFNSKNDARFLSIFIGYPAIVFSILIFISTNHIHYSLSLLPFISLLCGAIIDYAPKISIRYRRTSILIAITVTLISFVILIIATYSLIPISNLPHLIDNQELISRRIIIWGSTSLIISLTFLTSKIDILNFSKYILIISLIQISILASLYAEGYMGNPNNKFKAFLEQSNIHKIVNTNQINLYRLPTKDQSLLKFYLPSYSINNSSIFSHLRSSYSIVPSNIINDLLNRYPNNVYTIDSYNRITLIKIVE